MKKPSEKFQNLFQSAVVAFGADCYAIAAFGSGSIDIADHHYEEYKAKVYAYVAALERKVSVK